jgi:hypothetical protein
VFAVLDAAAWYWWQQPFNKLTHGSAALHLLAQVHYAVFKFP